MAEKNAAEKKAKKDTGSRVKAVLGGKSHKGKKKKLKGMHVRHAASGGYIAKHEPEMDPAAAGPQDSPEHIVPDMEALKSHMEEHMGQPGEGGGEEPAAPAPAPGAAAV